jgi:hypothetical protein
LKAAEFTISDDSLKITVCSWNVVARGAIESSKSIVFAVNVWEQMKEALEVKETDCESS